MKKEFIWTEERQELLVDRLRNNETQAAIAASFGIKTANVVRQVAKMRDSGAKGMPIGQQDTIPDCLIIPTGRRRSEPSKNFADDIGGRVNSCQYLSEPAQRDFCGESVLPGKSYCQKHYEKCYVKRDTKAKRTEFAMSMILGM